MTCSTIADECMCNIGTCVLPLFVTDSVVRAKMPYWYRPTITREEAIEYVRHLEPGGFIVRDSQTVSGGYALTIKVSSVDFPD